MIKFRQSETSRMAFLNNQEITFSGSNTELNGGYKNATTINLFDEKY